MLMIERKVVFVIDLLHQRFLGELVHRISVHVDCLTMCGFSAKPQLHEYGKKHHALQHPGEQFSRTAIMFALP